MEALSSLNLADNNVRQLVSEGGWIIDDAYSTRYRNPDGKNHTNEKPEDEDFKPRGFIVIANVIPDMRAMTSLNLANNSIGYGGNMDGIKAISSAVKVLAAILVPF